jgi:hypothetical protein
MLDMRFVPRALRAIDGLTAEVLACGAFTDQRPFTGLAGLIDWRLVGRLSRLAKEEFLLGELGELLIVPARPKLPFDKLLVAGLGPRATFGESSFRRVLERMLHAIDDLQAKTAVLEWPGRGDEAIVLERAAQIHFEVAENVRCTDFTVIDCEDSAARVRAVSDERRRARSLSRRSEA